MLKGLWKEPVLPSGFSQAHPAARVLPQPPAPPAAAAAAPRPPRKCAPSKQNPGSHLTMGTPAPFLRYGEEVLAECGEFVTKPKGNKESNEQHLLPVTRIVVP